MKFLLIMQLFVGGAHVSTEQAKVLDEALCNAAVTTWEAENTYQLSPGSFGMSTIRVQGKATCLKVSLLTDGEKMLPIIMPLILG